jgi:16S rRNA processing protein RimM
LTGRGSRSYARASRSASARTPGLGGAPAGSLRAGTVGRPHGLDGSFYVADARPRLLEVGMSVTLAGRSVVIVRRAGTERRPIVRVEGVEDRSAAQAVRGAALTVRERDAPALGEGEWWAHELEGCEVLDGARRVGIVARLVELPSCEALEVRREHEQPLLVPMVKDAIREVSISERRIDVDMSFLQE